MAAHENDPFATVLSELSDSDQMVINDIARRVNNRVSQRVGAAPKAPGIPWQVYVGGAALLIGVTVFIWWYTGSEDTPAIDAANHPVAEHNPGTPSGDVAALAGAEHQPDSNDDLTASNDPANVAGNNNPGNVEPEVILDPDPTEDGRASDPEVFLDGGQGNTDGPQDTEGGGPQGPDANNVNNATDPDPEQRNTGQNAPPRMAMVAVKIVDKHTYVETKSNNNNVTNPNLGRDDSKAKKVNTLLPEEMPEYPGGEVGLQRFIRSKMDASLRKNPELLGESVYVFMIVNHKGKVSDIEARSDNAVLKAEAERILSEMPDWYPGTKKGKIEAVVSITFK